MSSAKLIRTQPRAEDADAVAEHYKYAAKMCFNATFPLESRNKMHQATLLSFLLLGIFVTLATAYNGQDIYAEPNCDIVEDHARKFRDISDPTHYWVCPEGQEKADYIQCPDNYAFMEVEQQCVVWEEWKWVEPYTK